MAFCVRTAFAAILGVLVSVALGQASTVVYRTDAQLVAASERVVHGRVVAQRPARVGQDGRVYTVTTLQLIQDLTGNPGPSVEIWELGGTDGAAFFYVGGAVEYRLGEEVLVFLERGPLGYRSVAMGFSKFDVLPAANGDRELRRNLRDTVVVGGAVTTRERTLSEFRDLVTVDHRPAAARLTRGDTVRDPAGSAAIHASRRRPGLSLARGRHRHTGDLVQEHERAESADERRCRQRDSDGARGLDGAGERVDRAAVRRHDPPERPGRTVGRHPFEQQRHQLRRSAQRDQRPYARHRRRLGHLERRRYRSTATRSTRFHAATSSSRTPPI